MQDNDFIRVDYSGKIKESNKTLGEAKNAPLIVGAGYVIKGVDEALKQMNIGEKKTIEVAPEKGFGKRDLKLIKLIPESEFRKRDKKPQIGMIVDIKNIRGRVISVSGGRVRIDFNHPLAGKILVYNIEIKERIEKPEEKIKAIIEAYSGISKIEVIIKEKEVEIKVPPFVNSLIKKKTADDVMKFLDIEKVKFVEVFEKPKEEPKKEEEK
jgi:FKBP-type peptidyl-prolyl cis-trans isomerase 2